MCFKENMLGCYRIEIRERSIAVFQCLAARNSEVTKSRPKGNDDIVCSIE